VDEVGGEDDKGGEIMDSKLVNPLILPDIQWEILPDLLGCWLLIHFAKKEPSIGEMLLTISSRLSPTATIGVLASPSESMRHNLSYVFENTLPRQFSLLRQGNLPSSRRLLSASSIASPHL